MTRKSHVWGISYNGQLQRALEMQHHRGFQRGSLGLPLAQPRTKPGTRLRHLGHIEGKAQVANQPNQGCEGPSGRCMLADESSQQMLVRLGDPGGSEHYLQLLPSVESPLDCSRLSLLQNPFEPRLKVGRELHEAVGSP